MEATVSGPAKALPVYKGEPILEFSVNFAAMPSPLWRTDGISMGIISLPNLVPYPCT